MEIKTVEAGEMLELQVFGALDSNWAEHLGKAIDEAVRNGSHRLLLNLGGVNYLSSAGISVLLKAHAQLTRIHGFFAVSNPSPQVHEVLKLTGLQKRLIGDSQTIRRSAAMLLSTVQPQFRCLTAGDVDFELYDLSPEQPLSCRMLGDPGRLPGRCFAAEDVRQVAFTPQTFGLGLGAFGNGFDDCRVRFGEFLAAGGAAVQLPAQNGSAPDYQLARDEFVPAVDVLYGAQFAGDFSQLARFVGKHDSPPVGLSTLAAECLSRSESDVVGMVIIAESAGLVGAALRQSPAMARQTDSEPAADQFAHPAVRDWLSFAPERVHPRSLALVVGVAARVPCQNGDSRLSAFLRPLSAEGDVAGHFHAAVFSYRPLKKRRLDLVPTVGALFESEHVAGVLHLLGDFRELNGAGESAFVSGACWVAPVAGPVAEFVPEAD
jgi:anti-anti-sigma factor